MKHSNNTKSVIEINYREALQRMLFRRQFFLGPEPFVPNQFWSSVKLRHELHLSVHQDLPFISDSDSNVTITLAGLVFDPCNPESTESNIIHSLIVNSSDIGAITDATKPLAGRWIIIFQNSKGTFLFTDPCGLRQVFYHSDGKYTMCASQPELINASHKLSMSHDETLFDLLMNPKHALTESEWVGNRTIYENCFHLMPNHYLDVNNHTQIRFYPTMDLPLKDASEIVESASSILQGTISGMTNRYSTISALTAGWDSRVLLAASKKVSGKIEYFIDRKGVLKENHPDIWVPTKLAKRLNIRFVVNNSSVQLPGWFIHAISRNVTCARVLPKNQIFYKNFASDEKRIGINGNGSEICRNYYDKFCKGDPEDLSLSDLVKIFGYNSIPTFAIKELNDWRNGLCLKPIKGFNLFDMLYWEQRIGNWAAQAFSEQDIVVEEISPFNNRLLIETLLSSDRRLRAAPDYKLYRELILKMWPEALSVPINPESFTHKLKKNIRPYIPLKIIEIHRRFLSR